MIDEKKLIYTLQNRIRSHEIESDIIRENGSENLDNICEMYLRLADECQAIIELIELQPKVGE